MISFEFKDNGSHHNDLFLRIDGRVYRCDSYYLANSEEPPYEHSASTTRRNLARVLDQWVKAIGQLQTGHLVYLPFEWDDEWLGVLQCVRRGDEVEILVGDLPINGFGVSLKDFSWVCVPVRDKSGERSVSLSAPWADPSDVITGGNHFRPKDNAAPLIVRYDELLTEQQRAAAAAATEI